MQCYTELTPPTVVTHAAHLSFTGPKANNLVVAKSSLLQIFDLRPQHVENEVAASTPAPESTSKLFLVAEYTLSGTVTALAPVKLLDTRAGGDGLLIAFRDAKMSLVEWNPEVHNISTISIHYYEGEDLYECPWEPDLSECATFLAPDPSSRCAALKFGARKLAILPFRQPGDDLVEDDYDPDFDAPMDVPESKPKQDGTGDANGEENKTPYKASFVLPLTALDASLTHPIHLAFLHEYREPTFGLISSSQAPSNGLLAERKDILVYSVFTLDLEQRASTMLLSVPGLPYDIWRVVPLPLPVGGSLLIGVNELIHVDQAGKTFAVGVNEFARKCSAFSMHDQSDLAMRLEGCAVEQMSAETGELLIILSTGDLAILTFRMDGRTVSGMTIQKVSEECGGNPIHGAASCAVSVGPNEIFIGSEESDSVLLAWTSKTLQVSRKRSRAQVVNEDADLSFDEEELDDFDDDLYGDEEPAAKKAAVATLETTNISQTIFKTQDTLINYGPMNAITLGSAAASSWNIQSLEPPPSLELMASVGRGKAGALAVLKREIDPVVLRQTLLPDVQSIWAVSARKQEPGQDNTLEKPVDQYFITSKPGMHDGEATTIYSVNGLALEESSEGDLERDGVTLDVGTLGSGTKIVQVLKNEIRTVDSELGLAQILPMMDEETGAEIQITSTSFADPYLLALRDDSSISVYAMDQGGELEELERGSGIKSTKWLSGCLYKSAVTDNKALAFLLSVDGSFQIFELPNLASAVFTTEGLRFLPSLVTADWVSPRRVVTKAGLTEILVADIGDSSSTSPYLIVRNSSDDINIYQPFHYPQADSQSFTENLRWLKVPQPKPPKYQDDSTTDLEEATPASSLRAVKIGGYDAVVQQGASLSIILKEASSLPRLLNIRSSPVSGVTALHTQGCDNGFATVTSDGVLRLCKMAPGFQYGELGWASRKIPMHENVDAICYHAQKQVYVIATTNKVEFSLPEDSYHHEWARENTAFKPQTERGTLKMIHPGNWSVIDVVELEEHEVALCVKVLNLEVSETTHERKSLVVVGTGILRGEDLATRGNCYVFEVISVVPEPGRPETNRKLRLIVKEEVKGAVTAVSEIGVQGFLLMAQGQKCMVRGLKEDGTLLPVAFMDMQTVVTVLKTLPGTGMVIMGDIARGVWFTGYTEEPYKMILFGKGRTKMDVLAADFLPHERNLYLVISDGECNIHVLQFDPEHPKSLSGARLLHKSTFHIGHFPTSLTLVTSSFKQTASSSATNGAPEQEGSDNATQEQYNIIVSTQSGALGIIIPLSEPAYRRLGALQTFLTSVLDHPCGLNPKAYRAVESEAFGGRGVLDGTLLRRYKELSWSKQVEGLGKVGVESGEEWVLGADLENIWGGGLGYL